MSAVNAEIRLLADRLGEPLDWSWPFVCECGDLSCSELASIPLAHFDESSRPGSIVAHGEPRTRLP